MNLREFHYDIPSDLIAQEPLGNRHLSRLMVLDKKSGEVEHKIFKDIIEYLSPGECLVLNNTRVVPARLIGHKVNSNSRVEFMLLKDLGDNLWEVMVKPGKHAKTGNTILFGNNDILAAHVLHITEEGIRVVKLEYNGKLNELLREIGIVPLPPYIHRQIDNKENYQTVYSKVEGSIAAPTAGLHFTDEILNELKAKGVVIAYVTLHVGLGTFKPVKVEDITRHKMHEEYFSIDKDNCDKINFAKSSKKRIIAVGTTSCRVLESVADQNGIVAPMDGSTDIFIYPGYKFKVMDALITNFHVPESTLIMLVSAFAGTQNIMSAYKMAVEDRYRFFSLGDAMYIR